MGEGGVKSMKSLLTKLRAKKTERKVTEVQRILESLYLLFVGMSIDY